MKKTLPLLILLCCLSLHCYAQKLVKFSEQGSITQSNFTQSIPFRYENKHIFIDVEIEGEQYNFLFDTGADLNIIDLNHINTIDFQKAFKVKAAGSSFKKHKVQLIEITALKIADLEFTGFGAAVMNLSFVNEDYPCFSNPIAGIIGANLLRKLSLQIDYQNQQLLFSDNIENFELPNNLLQFEMTSKSWGSPRVNVLINGTDKTFIVDTGSGGKITTNISFKETLDTSADSVDYVSITREDASNKLYTEYYAQVASISMDDIKLDPPVIALERGVSSLIGNQLLENYTLTIDWENNKLYLAKTNDQILSPLINFEIQLRPNYTTKKIEIYRIYNIESASRAYKVGTEIVSINDQNVFNFSKQELCEFWNSEWAKIQLNDSIMIETETGKFELNKTDLLKK